jgi:hypothetical protein
MNNSLETDVARVIGEMRHDVFNAPPYCIKDDVFQRLLVSGGKPFPTLDELQSLLAEGKLGPITRSFVAIESGTHDEKQKADITAFLFFVYASLISQTQMTQLDKLTEEKILLFVCHCLAKHWHDFECACSGISLRIIYRNQIFKSVLDDENELSLKRLYHHSAKFGACSLLCKRFRNLKRVSPEKQVLFLLNDVPNQSPEKREMFAIAWACRLMEDRSAAENGVFDRLSRALADRPEILLRFFTALETMG